MLQRLPGRDRSPPLATTLVAEPSVEKISTKIGWKQFSGPLFRKYIVLFLSVVCFLLISNGLFEVWFSYSEHRSALIRIQREQADAAAAKIGQFIKEIES